MPSSFAGQDLFGSSPHRFHQAVQGQLVLPNIDIGLTPPGSTPQGLMELDVIVRGRLVAASEAALWSARDAITLHLTDPPEKGKLIDHHGREWENMHFITFKETDRTDRGRTWSIGFEAVFRGLIA